MACARGDGRTKEQIDEIYATASSFASAERRRARSYFHDEFNPLFVQLSERYFMQQGTSLKAL
jgi:hypothetical protein